MLLHYAQLPEAGVEPGFLVRDMFHCGIAPVGAALDVQESGRNQAQSVTIVDGPDKACSANLTVVDSE
jgi:hypothetical protein